MKTSFHTILQVALWFMFDSHGIIGSTSIALQSNKFRLYEALCSSIRDCSPSVHNSVFVRHFLHKVIGMPENTQTCYPSAAYSKKALNWTTGFRGKHMETQIPKVKLRECKQKGYRSVRAGGETLRIKVHKQQQTWDQALNICRSEGATLAMPKTREKENAMKKWFPFNTRVWIGLRDFNETNTYMWIDGTSLSYTNWEKGQPTFRFEKFDEDCVISIKEFIKSRWVDLSCLNDEYFICQC